MKEKAIEILRQQIDKLEDKHFDLESWKTGTAILLGKLFGESSEKTVHIRKLQLDYSSWTLRDTSGEGDPMIKIKRMARDILEAGIAELEIFGLPGSAGSGSAIEPIRVALQEHLRMHDYKHVAGILNAGSSLEEKKQKLSDFLMTLPPKVEREILITLLSHDALKEQL